MDKLKKPIRIIEKSMNVTFSICGITAVVFVLLITGFLVVNGIPAIKEIGITDFLFGSVWAPTTSQPLYGILPFILSSIYGTMGAIVIGVPIGVMCAIFIAKIAPKRLADTMRTFVDLLSGIPSVVYGLANRYGRS